MNTRNPCDRALQALDAIAAAMKAIDAVYAGLPRDWREAIDRSTLADLSPRGIARLSNELASRVAA